MKREKWKPVLNHEGFYEISNFGRVKSLKRKSSIGRLLRARFLSPKLDRSGSYNIELRFPDGTKRGYYIYRLMAVAFIPNPENKAQVNHKNGNRKDNKLENLEWATPSENMMHKFRVLKSPPVGEKPVIQLSLSGDTIQEFKSVLEAARQLGIDHRGITQCVLGYNKSASGFKWERPLSKTR